MVERPLPRLREEGAGGFNSLELDLLRDRRQIRSSLTTLLKAELSVLGQSYIPSLTGCSVEKHFYVLSNKRHFENLVDARSVRGIR